jgi:hypothetical protein
MLGVDDYQALVQAKRPKLKPNSARTYAVSLNTIAPPDSTNANWVSDVPYVLKQLDRYKDTTKKNTLNAVIVLVEADSIAIKRYTKERDHYNDRYSDLMKAQQKTGPNEWRLSTALGLCGASLLRPTNFNSGQR